MGLAALELVVHPAVEAEPLALEEVLAGLGERLCFEAVYIDKYIRLYVVGRRRLLEELQRMLHAVYGRGVAEPAEAPSLRSLLAAWGCTRLEDGRLRVARASPGGGA
ncbi:MAG TPA: hypothetical protein EYP33_00720 [Pyrodictium sp.]|nr:hypothetical protein [Pyrodictium sp.]